MPGTEHSVDVCGVALYGGSLASHLAYLLQLERKELLRWNLHELKSGPTGRKQREGLLAPTLCPDLSWHLFFCLFLGLHPWHMEIPRLGVESELQLPAYATAMAMWDPDHICDLHHSSWQHWILNPLSEARDRTLIFVDTSRVRFR